MFGLLKNDKLIGVHDEIEIIEIFRDDQSNASDEMSHFDIIKLKNDCQYDGLYLVPYHGCCYVPKKYYDIMVDLYEDDYQSIQMCKETLLRVVKEYDLTHKECKVIEKSIKILVKLLVEEKCFDVEDLDELSSYKEKLMNER